ncbi:phage tail protein, partial [Thioclava sp. BHET1]
MVAFTNYPVSNRVPGFYAEINPSLANTATINQNSLLIGPMLSAGSAVANEPVLVSGADPDELFGPGSILALMVKQYVASDPFGTLYALPVADDGAAVKASSKLTFTGNANAAGVVSLYVAGTLISTAVALGDTAAAVATNVAAKINATAGLPVSATDDAAAVTITALN